MLFAPIRYAWPGDTDETVRQVVIHNAKWDEACG
jgi:hypothetical protein